MKKTLENPMLLISRSALGLIENFAEDARSDAGCVAAAILEEWVRRTLPLHSRTMPPAEVERVVDRAKSVKRRRA